MTTNTPIIINTTIKTIDKQSIFDGVKYILTIVRPQWEQEKIQHKFVTGGITNALVSSQHSDDKNQEDVVLIRIYGEKTELLIDREQEKRNILFLHHANIAPPLYATFHNGLVYKFVKGITLSQENVVQPKIYKLVAAQMAKLHKVTKREQNGTKAILWEKTQAFLDLVPDKFDDPEKQSYFEKCFPGKAAIANEIANLKQILHVPENSIVFAHNDLLLGNIIYDEATSSVTFIDFEYAADNYQAFDIGNHFAEFIGTENIQLGNYPSKELQFDWLREYLKTYNHPEPVLEEEITELYIRVNKFSLMAHIFWGLWSLIQAANSKIDFDFIEYGALRINEYFRKKDEILSLGSSTKRY